MSGRNRHLLAARETLGVTREELAALMSLDWQDYLAAERLEGELPPSIQEALDGVVRKRAVVKKVDKEAILPSRYRGQFFQGDRAWWYRAVAVPLVFVAAFCSVQLFNTGRVWLGLLVAWLSLMAVPFALHSYVCRTCGNRLGPVALIRRRCPDCGGRFGVP